jgi:hypothetical protein
MANPLGVRLVHNFTHPTDLIIDLTAGPQLARAVIAARRRRHLRPPGGLTSDGVPAALIVTGWPPLVGEPGGLFTRARARLTPGAAWRWCSRTPARRCTPT